MLGYGLRIGLEHESSCGATRRLLSRAYPGDNPAPKSGSTVTKCLLEDAAKVKLQIQRNLKKVRQQGWSRRSFFLLTYTSVAEPRGPNFGTDKSPANFPGFKLALSFDEATFVRSDSYLTVNVHFRVAIFGASRVAPLGLIRVESRATAEYLRSTIDHRLSESGLSHKDFLAAATDGTTNVLKAVNNMGLKKQKCFAHGISLVINRIIYGKESLANNIAILVSQHARGTESSEDEEDKEESENELEAVEVVLGEAVSRLRTICRYFERRPVAMGEIRSITAKNEFNNKRLEVVLDCKTRWFSTLNMIERALEIPPALNYFLSMNGTPVSVSDAVVLGEIAAILAPFKRALLVLCKENANLLHADRVFLLLIQDLRNLQFESELANLLYENLKLEIPKRRSILSSALQVLCDPNYDYMLERELGQRQPSSKEILDILAEIIDGEIIDGDDSTNNFL